METRLRRKKHETAAAMTTVLLIHSLSLSSLSVPACLHGKVPSAIQDAQSKSSSIHLLTAVLVELRIQLGAMCHIRVAVGCLMYRMTETRPSIVFAMSRAVRAMDRPTEADWTDMSDISLVSAENEQLWFCVRSWKL
jgi:hypothetical protein